MPLKFVGETCGIEVYGPDEDGVRVICTKVSGCPLNHPGEIGLDCLLNKEQHPEMGLYFSGAGNAVPEAGVQMPGPTSSSSFMSRTKAYDGPPLPQSRTATGTPEVEPGAGNTGRRERRLSAKVRADCGLPEPDSHINSVPGSHLNKIISHEVHDPSTVGNASGSEKTFSENSLPPDSHMVVDNDEKWWIRDLHEEQAKKGGFISREAFEKLLSTPGLNISQEQLDAVVETLTKEVYSAMPILTQEQKEKWHQYHIDALNKADFDRWEEYERSGTGHHGSPPPIPILGPEASKKFLEDLANFKLTPEQQEFYQDAIHRFPPERPRKLLKHHRRYAPRRTAGMIRMSNEQDGEEESQFEEMHGPVDVPSVKPQTELEKEIPKPERPEEPEEPEEDETEEVEEGPEQVIEESETVEQPGGLGGYVYGLEVWTDEDKDHTVVLTVDNVTIEFMLPDFLQILSALNKAKGRLVQIQNE